MSATALGIEAELASYFVALANAGSLLGRYASGILADKIGQSLSYQYIHVTSDIISIVRTNECDDPLHAPCCRLHLWLALYTYHGSTDCNHPHLRLLFRDVCFINDSTHHEPRW